MKRNKLKSWQEEIWNKCSYNGIDVHCKACGSWFQIDHQPTTTKEWKDLQETQSKHKHNEDWQNNWKTIHNKW